MKSNFRKGNEVNRKLLITRKGDNQSVRIHMKETYDQSSVFHPSTLLNFFKRKETFRTYSMKMVYSNNRFAYLNGRI